MSETAIEVQSPETLAEAEIWREAMPRQPSAKYGTGEATDKLWITSATKKHRLTGSQILALDLNVDTQEEVVTLLRIVPLQEGKAAAPDVRKMRGVQRVDNEGEGPDEEVTREVKKAFDRPAFKDITVAVKNGVVRLTGTVPSWAWRLEAVAAARALPGVRAVEDDLRFMVAV
jgi:osmotically-inducible protein OsmY